jgi:nucleotide-binding universal stress UspA family protein
MEPTEQNRRAWDEIHGRADGADEVGIPEAVRERLPDVTGKHVLHLQCGSGEATAELAGLGALVTGVDSSSEVLAVAQGLVPEELGAVIEQAPGDTVEDAVANLSWLPGEVVLVGSSRLAQPRRLFLGSTAAKMLHELPVPMIVVPRTRAEAGVR